MVKPRFGPGGNDVGAKTKRLGDDLAPLLERMPSADGLDLVIGVPFFDEDTTVARVVAAAQAGAEAMGLAGRACVVVIGPREHDRVLDRSLTKCCQDHPIPALAGVHSFGLEGQGWAVRALLEVAAKRSAALVVLPASLIPIKSGAAPGSGFSPEWVRWMAGPVLNGDAGLALARYTLHPLEHPVEALLAHPVMTGVFGFRLRQPTPGVLALSASFARRCTAVENAWPDDAGAFGGDPWIVARALVSETPACEVPVGLPSFLEGTRRLKLVFRQVAHALFRQVADHADFIMARPETISRPNAAPGFDGVVTPAQIPLDSAQLFRRFKREFDHFDQTLFSDLLPDDIHAGLRDVADESSGGRLISAEEWVQVVSRFLTAYRFDTHYAPDDIVDGLFPLFLARMGAFIQEIREVEPLLKRRGQDDQRRRVLYLAGEDHIRYQARRFASARASLRDAWEEREKERAPYIPQIGSWEFVPGVGVSVPQTLPSKDGGEVLARDIYVAHIERLRERFMGFVSGELRLPAQSRSSEILSGVHDFMVKVDRSLHRRFDYDLTSVDGARELVTDACNTFSRRPWLQLETAAARDILVAAPPQNLITRLRCRGVGQLLERYEPNDALAMASWTERSAYLEHVLHVIEDEADPSWFTSAPVRPMGVDASILADPTELRGLTSLARLSGRLVMSNLHKGWGGEYPTLWYLLRVVQNVVAAEMLSEIREQYAQENERFGERVANTIRGHWGRHVQSEHNFFMNRQQRNVTERLQKFSQDLERDEATRETGHLLGAAMGVYDVSVTLPDATFVPLSAWTWTSYSYRGGLGAPTPLSSLVERDWATVDFITDYAAQAGIADEASIYARIVSLVGEGLEHTDLGRELFGDAGGDVLDIQQAPAARRVTAGRLERPIRGPILEPIASHTWESRYVLNAAAFRLDGNVYILYRAFGEDETSRIGMAWSKNGIDIDGRLDQPVFGPAGPDDARGTEDPRVTQIGDRLYMIYTAYDGSLPQIAMASISCDAFLERRFDQWQRHGLAYPGLPNKDAVLFPEKFDGRFAIYHRIDPNMWLSYVDDLECPWPRAGHKIFLRPRPGMMWDAIKIGAGAQPIKTTHGWLNIYHGVDYEKCYRLGVLFMPLDDPGRVIYQSPNAILEPELDFEVGGTSSGDFWVPHVVFTCGAVPAEDKDIIGPEDDILVYYGAADTAIGVARGKLRDLVPIIESDRHTPDDTSAGR